MWIPLRPPRRLVRSIAQHKPEEAGGAISPSSLFSTCSQVRTRFLRTKSKRQRRIHRPRQIAPGVHSLKPDSTIARELERSSRQGYLRTERSESVSNPSPSATSTSTPIASFNPTSKFLGACQRKQRDPDKNRASKCFEASDTCGRKATRRVG